MTNKLSLYNDALVTHLGKRRLSSLSESSESRRALDDAFDDVVAYCLERKFWNFSYRAVQIDASVLAVPTFGFLYAFKIPDDWIRTRLLSAVETFDPPLLQVKEETGYWYASITPIYVQYNSSGPLFGMNLGAWPASFADYVSTRLARRTCNRITGSAELLAGPGGLIKQEERAYKVAAANCAMNEAVGFAPRSSWVRARRGFGPGMGGDEPPGGSLVG
jgi:hypothetical protein